MAQIPLLVIFAPNTVIKSAEVNNNFSQIRTTYNAHDIATTGVHGVTGTIMGTTDVQTVTNKTFNSDTPIINGRTWTWYSDNLITAKIILNGATGDITSNGGNLNMVGGNINMTAGGDINLGAGSVINGDGGGPVIFSGNIRWLSGTAFYGELDHANTADRVYTFPDAAGNVPALPTAATTETGSGAIVRTTTPTLDTPVIANFTSAQHDHLDADDGGTLDAAAIASGTFADARISQTSVTQHEAALTIVDTQITNTGVFAVLADNESITGDWSVDGTGTLTVNTNGGLYAPESPQTPQGASPNRDVNAWGVNKGYINATFDGAGGAIVTNDAYNITSIAYYNAGGGATSGIRITWDSDFASGNYTVDAWISEPLGNPSSGELRIDTRNVGTLDLTVVNSGTGNALATVPACVLFVTVYGELA